MNWITSLFSDIWAGLNADFLQSAISVTAWCELAIISLFCIAVVYVFSGLYKGLVTTNYYVSRLEGLNSDNLASKRQDVLESIEEKYYPLWKEFDESLVNDGENRSRLGNTLDAVHFFNIGNIAPVFENSRFLKAVPGMLTGIGVLGTFAGLYIGLKGINVGGSNPDELRAGINVMISGASAAFFTSIWGVGASLLFTVIEKPCEAKVRNKLTDLRNRIDYLYPRITSEESLAKIDRTLDNSHIELKTLAEQIGTRMQEVMSESTASMSQAIAEALSGVTPAMEKLTNGAAESSEKAMEVLLDKFIDKVGSAGQDQQKLMAENSGLLTSSIETVTRDLRNSVGKMTADIGRISVAQTSASDSVTEQMQRVTERVSEMMSLADTREQERLQGTTEAIARVNDNQQVAADQMLTIRDSFSELIIAHSEAAKEMMQTVEQMREVTGGFSDSSLSLKNASQMLGQDIKSATTLAFNTVNDSQEILTELKALPPAFQQVTSSFVDTSSNLTETVSEAKEGFHHIRESMTESQRSLVNHIEEIEDKMAGLLKEFAAETKASVDRRMTEWNSQTTNYTDSMMSAMNALSEVVDQMDRTTKRSIN